MVITRNGFSGVSVIMPLRSKEHELVWGLNLEDNAVVVKIKKSRNAVRNQRHAAYV